MIEAAALKRMSDAQLRATGKRIGMGGDLRALERYQLITAIAGRQLPDTLRYRRSLQANAMWLNQLITVIRKGPFDLAGGTAEITKAARSSEIAQAAAEERKSKGIAKVGTNGGSLTDAEIVEILHARDDHPKLTCQAISDRYQNRVNANMIWAILKNQAYKHVPRS